MFTYLNGKPIDDHTDGYENYGSDENKIYGPNDNSYGGIDDYWNTETTMSNI